jgi:heat shock protein 1/8
MKDSGIDTTSFHENVLVGGSIRIPKVQAMRRFEDGDKEKIEKAVLDAFERLEKNQLAEKEEFEAKPKEHEGVVNPIVMKVYQAAGGAPEGGMPGGGGGAGPTVQEAD